MLVVHGGRPGWGVADVSPACLKLKTYLQMASIPFQSRPGLPFRGPTKTIPYVEDDGKAVGDSSVIIAHLKTRYGDPLDAKWSAEDLARGHALQTIVESSLYWLMLCVRWERDDSFAAISSVLGEGLPALARPLIMRSIRAGIKKRTWAEGTGRISEEARQCRGKADIDTIAAFLGNRHYVLGDTPSSYDATVYGHLANVLAFPAESPLKAYAASKKNLVDYCGRIRERYWHEMA
jgi:glutathione S-transferase